MCQYQIGQKVELWKIEGPKHPHRVVSRRVVTITAIESRNQEIGILQMTAKDSDGREYIKNRAAWMPLAILETFSRWNRKMAPAENWQEAILAATYAIHSRSPFHYWDGHGKEMKPKGKVHYCGKHHIWTYKGWVCPEKGMPSINHLHCISAG